MLESGTYSVITSGELQGGFEPAQVRQALAALFKIPPERADGLLKSRRAIKKETDLKTAETYKRKLESIGLVVTLQEHTRSFDEGSSLSLVPMDDEVGAENTAAPQSSTAIAHTDTCPKCNLEQPAGADQCQGCGVFMHKVRSQADSASSVQQTQATDRADDSTGSADEEHLTGKSLVVGAVAALLGALVWNLVATVFGYELGLVAWAIGGAVGFAVATTGSSGKIAGIACGVLALIAIVGGKYMIYSSVQDNLTEIFGASTEEIRPIYDSEMAAAEAYPNVSDGNALRQFMVEYGYSEHVQAKDITEEEIEYFYENEGPRLVSFSYRPPTFEDWYQVTVLDTLANLSTLDMMKENLGGIDLLFLLLGVGTAFRLGRGGDAATA